MKKLIMICISLACMVMVTACNIGEENRNGYSDQPDETPTPKVTAPAEEPGTDEQLPEDSQTGDEEDLLLCTDFYPFMSAAEYVYEGSGNEYASFRTTYEYLDPVGGRMQTRTNNGGTETVRVLEYKDGKLMITKTVPEYYSRDNLLDSAQDEEAEILLMEPLIPGTSWELPDGRKRIITASDVLIETPSGNYRTLEVTTESEDSIVKDYYARNTGLVKSLFLTGDYEVSSSLSQINR